MSRHMTTIQRREVFVSLHSFDFAVQQNISNFLMNFFFYLANEKVVIDYSKNGAHPGFLPDGLTIDTDGNLYVTTFGDSKVYKVDPK